MSFFVNILALAVPVFTMQVYDRVVGHAGISTLAGLVLGMFFVLAFDYVLRQSRSRILQRVALRVDVMVGRQVFEKFISLPLSTLEAKPGAHWQSLFRDVDIVRNTLSGASAVLVADLPFVVLFGAIICVIALPVAWVLAVLLPIFVFVAWRSSAVMANANREERDASHSRDSLVTEMIGGRTTIKALALDRAIRPIWEERHAENIERSITRGGKADGYTNLGTTLTMLTTICLTAVGSVAIIEQHLTMGGLIAANMLSGRLIGPLNQLVNQWRTYSSFKQAAERLGQFFNEASERVESEIKLDKPRGEISIENVTFSYIPDGAPVVDNVSLKIEQGGVNALVGRNGSGKTTLLKILQGLYIPASGRVLLDGADISQFSRAELATWMGYVPQENVLFAGTVRDNIAHRIPTATDEEIIRAAKAAGIHQFIIDQPNGYATDIGEAGQRLSGGQRQRISIARALVGQPPVLLLDEPSSSLDRQAEHDLRKTLEEIGQTCTVVIVTHSPVLLAACRDLTALDRGRVALTGPAHDILPRLFGAGAKPAATPPPSTEAKPVSKKRPSGEAKGAAKPVATAASEKAAKPRPAARESVPAEKAVEPSPLLRSISSDAKPAAKEAAPAKAVVEPSPLLRSISPDAAKPAVGEPMPAGRVAEARPAPRPVAPDDRPDAGEPAPARKPTESKPALRPIPPDVEPAARQPAPARKTAEPRRRLLPVSADGDESDALPAMPSKAPDPSPLLQAITAVPVSNEDDGLPPRKRKAATAGAPSAGRGKAAASPAPVPAVKPSTKPILRVAPAVRSAAQLPTNGGPGGANGKGGPSPSSTGTRPRLVVHEAGKRTGTNGMSLPTAHAEGNGE